MGAIGSFLVGRDQRDFDRLFVDAPDPSARVFVPGKLQCDLRQAVNVVPGRTNNGGQSSSILLPRWYVPIDRHRAGDRFTF